jgi:hypothetical protein
VKFSKTPAPCQSSQESDGIGKPLLKNLSPGKNERTAAAQAAKIAGSNRTYVYDVQKIKRIAPELIPQIAAGTLTIPQAKRLIATGDPNPQKKRSANPEALTCDEWLDRLGDAVSKSLAGCPPKFWPQIVAQLATISCSYRDGAEPSEVAE